MTKINMLLTFSDLGLLKGNNEIKWWVMDERLSHRLVFEVPFSLFFGFHVETVAMFSNK